MFSVAPTLLELDGGLEVFELDDSRSILKLSKRPDSELYSNEISAVLAEPELNVTERSIQLLLGLVTRVDVLLPFQRARKRPPPRTMTLTVYSVFWSILNVRTMLPVL